MIIVPFEPQHLSGLKLQAAQILLQPTLASQAYGEALRDGGQAFSGVVDGKIVGSGGIVNIWEGRAVAWALFTPDALANFMPAYRAIQSFLEISDMRRIEAFVDCGFEKAHNLARKLGFTMECERMRGFTPDGRDCALYSRVRSH